MSEPPFPFITHDTGRPGTLELYVEFARTADSQKLHQLRLISAAFVTLVQAGAFATDDESGIGATAVRMSREDIHDDGAHWIFELGSVVPAVAAVLRNALIHVHHNVVAIAGASLTGASALGFSTGARSVSIVPQRVPFDYHFDASRCDVVIELEFEHPVPDEETRQRFVRVWEAWLYLAGIGAFQTTSIRPNHVAAFPGGAPESSADEMTFYLDDVSLDPPAFDFLLNVFGHLHRTKARVRSVLIT